MSAITQGASPPLRRFSLRFCDPQLEHAYRRETFSRTLIQGRAAILVGMLVYLLCGLLDIWHVPPEARWDVWQSRLTALMVPSLLLVVSFTAAFQRLAQWWLLAVCVAAGFGLIAIQSQVPLENTPYYYPAMVMLTFYTYNFIGLRFPYALGIDALLLATYNLVFGVLLDYPAHILFSHNVFIVSANLIGGTTGYLVERQGRQLFLREKELEEERRFHRERSLHDPLTGLPNRELLYDRLEQALVACQRNQMLQGGLFIDLDGFKQINDRLGHRMGDNLLEQVAQRLTDSVRKTDTVARIGGDEFFVLARDLDSEQDIHRLASKLLENLRLPLAGVPAPFALRASIGVCLFPYPDMSVNDIIHRADMAMYRVKTAEKDSYCLAELKPCQSGTSYRPGTA
ncbi:GGDEF domain-containing protein [Billgrantia diversa]|uniref:GGDEF domain-containing protein n=1 Tax=Halomonas sp. MCCC 1A13316 TaxID=2733487 RepID=UPI0018A58A16|nr:GGDEF domain-containing protein [Halomonas sp. MCCC 1A13316]QOR38042.1 GGDEF domain-containing protein [Halomonas sp. MCCC 1A13316]